MSELIRQTAVMCLREPVDGCQRLLFVKELLKNRQSDHWFAWHRTVDGDGLRLGHGSTMQTGVRDLVVGSSDHKAVRTDAN